MRVADSSDSFGDGIERRATISFPSIRSGREAKSERLIDPRSAAGAAPLRQRQCPKCGAAALIHQEGCDLRTACGYSKCG